MKKIINLIILLVLSSFTSNAQTDCNNDPKLLANKELLKTTDIEDPLYAAYHWFNKYQFLVCNAKYPTFERNGKVNIRTQQGARTIEDDVLEMIDNYNASGESPYGKLQTVKCAYGDSIGKRTDLIVGFWIAEDYNKMHEKYHYPEFYFGNNNVFHSSSIDSDLEKSTWKKTGAYTYEVTRMEYDSWYKKWLDPFTSTFTIDPFTCTATNTFDGENYSTWYFKGVAYNMYNKSREELKKSSDCKLK